MNNGKRGIQMNVHPDSSAESVNEIKYLKGNFLIAEMIFADNPILIVGAYAPNDDEDDLWIKLHNKISDLAYSDIIIAGHFDKQRYICRYL